MIPQHIGKTSEREMNEMAEESYRQITGQNPVIPQPQIVKAINVVKPYHVKALVDGWLCIKYLDGGEESLSTFADVSKGDMIIFGNASRHAPTHGDCHYCAKCIESERAEAAAQARDKLFEAIRAERDPHLDYVDWDSIEAAYKHLDVCLGDPEWGQSGDSAAIYGIAGELWRAVKEAREKHGTPCEECHINPIIEQKRGCLTCRDPECPVWQAADQNCWKSQEGRDDAIRQDERDKVLDLIIKESQTAREENRKIGRATIDDAGKEYRRGCAVGNKEIGEYAESLRSEVKKV